MRIGGNIEKPYKTPEEWLTLVNDLNYSCVLVPVNYEASLDEKKAYLKAIKKNDLILGEVGAWRNPLSTNEQERREAIFYCKQQLALAEEMGANCCVNIVGARGEKWDGIYQDNYSDEVYKIIIESIQEIIDAVNPKKTFYTVEPMPWMVPNSPDAYLKLIKDVDREAFGVHLDFTNMINNPKRYIYSDHFISECFEKLGPYIKSIHLKDIQLDDDKLPSVIEEVLPGEGSINFAHVLKLCEELGSDTTVYVEHLDSYEEYKNAVDYIRRIGKQENINIK